MTRSIVELSPGSSDRVRRGGRAREGGHTSAPGSSALAALVAQLERRAAEAEQEGATAPVANVYRVVLEELRALNGASAPDPAPAASAAELLTVREASRRLGVSVKWLYRHPRLPFLRRLSPGVVRVDAAALALWVARRA